jgi:hypothetical protein
MLVSHVLHGDYGDYGDFWVGCEGCVDFGNESVCLVLLCGRDTFCDCGDLLVGCGEGDYLFLSFFRHALCTVVRRK